LSYPLWGKQVFQEFPSWKKKIWCSAVKNEP